MNSNVKKAYILRLRMSDSTCYELTFDTFEALEQAAFVYSKLFGKEVIVSGVSYGVLESILYHSYPVAISPKLLLSS